MQVEAQTLCGNALIWAVCSALNQSPVVAPTGIAFRSEHGSWVYPRYTEDDEAGQLMASEWISAERPNRGQPTPLWRSVTDVKYKQKGYSFNQVVSAHGHSLGEAVCRALVLSRLGKMVDVPDDLLTHASS